MKMILYLNSINFNKINCESKMTSLLKVVLMTLLSSTSGAEKRFNILSLDGGTYKGMMTAKFVDIMEEKAYFIAKSQFSP